MEELIYEGFNKKIIWRNRILWKNPLDLFIYAEIVHRLKPTLVIETGSYNGGSALFWLDMMKLNGGGRVISIDTEEIEDKPIEDGLIFITGSSLDEDVLKEVSSSINKNDCIIVNLDSNHSYEHVFQELQLYSKFVTPNSYLIVEDGIDDFRRNKKGVYKATIDFLSVYPEFEVDKECERLIYTNCPNGFLRRL